MIFRDQFAWSHKLNGKWSLDRIVDTGLRANQEQVKALQKTVKSTFEQGIDRIAQSQMAASAALQAELSYQADRIGQQILQGSSDMVSAIEQGSSDIVNTIQQMSDYLGSGLCEIRWSVERQTRISEEILRVLLNSLDNESRQYFEQGVKCYETTEYEFGRERFNKALEANRTNYFAYQYLGFIAVQENNSEEAIRNFDLARKFSENSYHRALALSHLARSYHAVGEPVKAADFAKGATDTHPDAAKFWYEFAAYSSLLGHSNQAIPALKEAIERDWTYWTVVIVDNDFDQVRTGVHRLLEELRETERNKARLALDNLKRAIDSAQKVGAQEEVSDSRRAVKDFESQFTKNNVFVHRELIPNAQTWENKAFQIAEEILIKRISTKKKDLEQIAAESRLQIAKLEGPLKELQSKQAQIGYGFKDSNPGCGGYFLVLLGFGIIMVPIIVRRILMGDGTVMQLTDMSFGENFLYTAFLIAVWLGGAFVLLKLLTPMVNKLRRQAKVTNPKEEMSRRIQAKQAEIEPLKRKTIEEFDNLAMTSDRELKELESYLEKCKNRQYV